MVLYIMGDASRKEKWGRGVMVLGEHGTRYLKAQIVFEAWGLSSKLIEATMVVAAVVAIDEWLRERNVVLGVWAWSDNLSAIRQLVEESLGEVGVDKMDRLVTEVGGLCFVPNWGWMPAQHDTGAKYWLAMANKTVDASAKEAVEGTGVSWRAPEVWFGIWSVFVIKGGDLVLNPQKVHFGSPGGPVQSGAGRKKVHNSNTTTLVDGSQNRAKGRCQRVDKNPAKAHHGLGNF